MKNILIIQSRKRPDMIADEQKGYSRIIGPEHSVNFISSLDESIDWNHPDTLLQPYDAVIFGGSGDFDFDGGRDERDAARITSREIVERVRSIVLHSLERDFPLLGICYGHQIVSEVLGVPVVNDHAQKKSGSHDITLTDAGKRDVLFCVLPETFVAQYGHKDSLSACPPGAVVLANSDLCKTSALRYRSNVYTMQFHPEMSREDVVWKLSNSPGYLPDGVDIESIARHSHEASTIIPRFIETIIP